MMLDDYEFNADDNELVDIQEDELCGYYPMTMKISGKLLQGAPHLKRLKTLVSNLKITAVYTPTNLNNNLKFLISTKLK